MPTARVGNPGNGPTTDVAERKDTRNHLSQNIPNPASEETQIPYSIQSSFHSAAVEVFELSTGRLVQAFRILPKDAEGSIFLKTHLLAPGLYGYRLVVDGRQEDVLKMSVVK